ncbi:MAG TPA: hypothetical protein VGL81_22460 [Polyangiaceae bacterium]|jgi:hypothetical protein
MANDKKQPAPAKQAPKGKAPERPVAKGGEAGKTEEKDQLITRGRGRPILGTDKPLKPIQRGRGAFGLGGPPPEDGGNED